MLWGGGGHCSTLFNVVNNISRHCYTLLQANSGSTIFFKIDDKQEQYCPNNIVPSCFEPPGTICGFWLGNTPIYSFSVAHMLSVKKYRSKQSSCIQVNGPNQLYERHLIQHQILPVDI